MDDVFPFPKASFLKSCHPRFGIAPSLPLFTLPKFLPLSSFPQSERMQETGTFIIHQNPFKFGGAVQDPGRPLDNLHPACGAGPCPGIPPRPLLETISRRRGARRHRINLPPLLETISSLARASLSGGRTETYRVACPVSRQMFPDPERDESSRFRGGSRKKT